MDTRGLQTPLEVLPVASVKQCTMLQSGKFSNTDFYRQRYLLSISDKFSPFGLNALSFFPDTRPLKCVEDEVIGRIIHLSLSST